jgi:hypothetical protein
MSRLSLEDNIRLDLREIGYEGMCASELAVLGDCGDGAPSSIRIMNFLTSCTMKLVVQCSFFFGIVSKSV